MMFAVINRGFGPENGYLGEAHAHFVLKAAALAKTCVIFQGSSATARKMKNFGDSADVNLRPCKSLTNSSSNLLLRVIEVCYFAVWVLFCLCVERPKKIYVSTDPPILVPFIVFAYAKIAKAEYFYHLQDIHPEAANIVIPLNRYFSGILRSIDNITMRHATCLITITKEMASFIQCRSETKSPIFLVDNPAPQPTPNDKTQRNRDYVFSGNLGRLQRIPLLISSIERYLEEGGTSTFTFVGGGIYSSKIELLANKFSAVEYFGKVSAQEAAEITATHRWAILPIEDQLSKFAFPSKSSSYVFSGCKILAVCDVKTSVSHWTKKHKLGLVVPPEGEQLVSCFFKLEAEDWSQPVVSADFRGKLDVNYFTNYLIKRCGLAVD